MSTIAITTVLLSGLILWLLFSGKWDESIDIITGHGSGGGKKT